MPAAGGRDVGERREPKSLERQGYGWAVWEDRDVAKPFWSFNYFARAPPARRSGMWANVESPNPVWRAILHIILKDPLSVSNL